MFRQLELLESRRLMSGAPVSAAVTADLAKLVADRAALHAEVAAGHATVVADHETIADTRKADLLAIVADRKARAHDHGNAAAEAVDMTKLTADLSTYQNDMATLKAKLGADFLQWKTAVHTDVLTVHADVLQLAKDRQAA